MAKGAIRTIRRFLLAAALFVTGSVWADAVSYVANPASGEYCGQGYKIDVDVSKPTSGYTIQYSETGTDGTWVDSLYYTNACTQKPMYFKIAASGYETAKGSALVTITPKALDEMLIGVDVPFEGYVYDGTAKEPAASYGDTLPAVLTENDFTVTYENNVNAGEATVTYAGKNNYTGTVVDCFDIDKADNSWTITPSLANWTYGLAPSTPVYQAKVNNDQVTITYSSGTQPTQPSDYTATFTVPESQNYNELSMTVRFTITDSSKSDLDKIFEGDGTVEYREDKWHVTLTNTPAGPYVLPGDLGNVVLDLHGCDVYGTNGVAGTILLPGGTGGPAITIDAPKDTVTTTPTVLKIVDSIPDAADDVIGGNGGDGNPGGDGGVGIFIHPAATAAGTKVIVGTSVGVRGGKGGKGLGGGADGADAPAIEGDYEVETGGIVEKAVVQPPQIKTKEYTGSVQTADVPIDARWKVVYNAGGTAVGKYPVSLGLTDVKRYCWPTDGSVSVQESTVYLDFEIAKAHIDVSHCRWNYSAPLAYTTYEQCVEITNLPMGVTAAYSGNRATDAGTYTAHATLYYNTDNYTAEDVPDLEWTISKGVPIRGGNVDPLGGDTINYSGTYDGEGHGISVILRDPRPAGACVKYARNREGPYASDNFTFTNVCRETIWYLVLADNYEPLTNSATVTITAKQLTAAQLKGKGLCENDRQEVVPALDFEDDWPCVLTADDWELVSWIPKAGGGGTAVVQGRNNYTDTLAIDIGNEMSIIFDAVYGSADAELRTRTTQEPGRTYTLPDTPYYRGHRFLGWFTARTGGTQVTAQTIVKLTDSTTLYAHWDMKSYRVSFELNGGSCAEDVSARTVTYGGSYGKLPVPTRQGYLFDGWYSTPDFTRGTEVKDDDDCANEDVTLYAKWNRRALWYTDAIFHLEAAAQWNGYMLDAEDRMTGSLSVKASKPNAAGFCNLTVTVQPFAGGKVSYRGTTFDGSFTSSDGQLTLRLGANGLSGTYGAYALDGSRNYFTAKDADSKVTAAQVLKKWQGTYVLVLGEDAGYAGLSLTIGAKGKVTVKGTTAQGTTVSGKSQLMVGERECALAFSWAKKSECLTFLVWFCEDGTVECAYAAGADYSLADVANARAGAYLKDGSVFGVNTTDLAQAIPGLLTDLVPDGLSVRMNDAKMVCDTAGKVALTKDKSGLDTAKLGTNPSGLKLTYTIKTCSFKGKCSLYTLTGGKIKKISATITGSVIDGQGYGTLSVKKVGTWPITIQAR